MINPLAPVFEWFLQFYASLPVSIQAFISLYFAFFVAVSIVFLVWRAKH